MTPEETQSLLKSISESLNRLNELTRKQVDLTTDSLSLDERKFKNNRKTLDDEKKFNEEIAKAYKKKLGVEETTNTDLKRTLDDRVNIEKKIVERTKKKMGEEQFIELQRHRFFKDQLEQYRQGSLEYGGVVTRFKDLNAQQQSELVKASKNQQILDKERAKFAETVRTLANPGQGIKEMSSRFGDLSSAFDEGKNALLGMTKGSFGATASIELMASGAKVLGAALQGVAKAALGMAKSLLNGERGMAVGARAVSTFTESITGAVKAFSQVAIGIGALAVVLAPFTGGASLAIGAGLLALGTVGIVAANVAETLAELNQIAAEVNDKLFSGFNELGKMSMTGARGMEDLKDSLHDMLLTTNEFDKFKAVISSNAKEMKMFGSTAAEGVKTFAKVSGELYKSEMGKTLELMGITAEEQYEHTAKYMALQVRLGLMQEKNAKDLAKSTYEYIGELDKIAAITGATRKEQEDARNAVMAIDQLRAGIMDEERKIREGVGDKKNLEALQRAVEFATTLQAQGLARQATGVAQYAGAGFISTTVESAEAMQAFPKTLKDIQTGAKTGAELSIQGLKESIAMAERASSTRRAGASGVGFMGESVAKIADMKAVLAEYEKRVEAEKKRLGKDFDEGKLLDEIRKERIAQDDRTKANVDLTRTQKETAVTLDNAALKFADAVGINKLAIDKFAKAVSDFDEWFNKKTKSDTSTSTQGGEDIPEYDAMGNFTGYTRVSSPSLSGAAGRPSGRLVPSGRAASQADVRSVENSMNTSAAPPTPVSSGHGQDPTATRQTGVISGLDQVKQEGLNIRPWGDVADGPLTSTALSVAKQIQSIVPGFLYFTGLNDKFHKVNYPSSEHAFGKGLDFVLSSMPTRGQANDIAAKLRSISGVSYVQDEYYNPSPGSTAPHFHTEVSAAGEGIASGPSSGYPAILHGNELIKKITKDSILDKLANTPYQETTQPISSPNSNSIEILSSIKEWQERMYTLMDNKLTEMIENLEDSISVQENIYRQTIN